MIYKDYNNLFPYIKKNTVTILDIKQESKMGRRSQQVMKTAQCSVSVVEDFVNNLLQKTNAN